MIRVIPVDVVNKKIEEAFCLRMPQTHTVGDLKEVIAERLRIPTADNMRCVLERSYSPLKPLDVNGRTLHFEGFQKVNKVGVLF
jgi:hypothetical protein